MRILNQPLTIVYLIFIVLISFIIYYPGLSGPFLLDDFYNLPSTIIYESSWDKWIGVALGGDAGHPGRIFSRLTFALNGWLFGNDSFSYKIINLILHAISALLVYILSQQLMLLAKVESSYAFLISGLTATIWLLHPLQVSTVLYTVQRMTIWSSLFSLLALITYIKARILFTKDTKNHLWMFFQVFFIWLPLSFLSKENGILLLLYLFIVEWAFLIKTKQQLQRLYLISIIALLLAAIVLTSKFDIILDGYSIRDFTLSERLLSQSQILWFYLYLILFPNENNMALYHDSFTTVRTLDIKTTIAILTHLLLIISAIIGKQRYPVIFIGTTWYYTGHLLESTIIPLEMVFEHRNYLPMFGPIIIVSYYFILLLHNIKKSIAILLVFSLVIIITLQTALRVLDWKTDISLATALVEKQPNSLRAYSDLTSALLKRNKITEAKQVLQLAIAKNTDQLDILLQYNSLFCSKELLPNNITELTENNLLSFKISNHIVTNLTLLIKMFQQNKCNNLEPFLLKYINALSKNPNLKNQQNLVSILYFLKARFYSKQKNIEYATHYYNKAYQNDLNKRSWRILLEQAEFYLSLELYNKADMIVKKITQRHLIKEAVRSNNFNKRFKEINTKLTQYNAKKNE